MPPSILKPVTKAILNLADTPRPKGSKKLKGNKKDFWRIRIGDYRVIYTIDDDIQIIDIQKVGHRKDIFKPGMALKVNRPIMK